MVLRSPIVQHTNEWHLQIRHPFCPTTHHCLTCLQTWALPDPILIELKQNPLILSVSLNFQALLLISCLFYACALFHSIFHALIRSSTQSFFFAFLSFIHSFTRFMSVLQTLQFTHKCYGVHECASKCAFFLVFYFFSSFLLYFFLHGSNGNIGVGNGNMFVIILYCTSDSWYFAAFRVHASIANLFAQRINVRVFTKH